MIESEQLRDRFDEFIHDLEEEGEVVLDALMVMAYVTMDDVDAGQTTYQQAVFGTPSMHRTIGLLELAKDEMLRWAED